MTENSAAKSPTDKQRLDWLDQNIFHREIKDDWDKRMYGAHSMWVLFAPKGHQGSARNIIDGALATSGAKVRAEPVKFGCHCDLEPGMQPDGCVLDYGRPEDCVHSKSGKVRQRESCEHWKPIVITGAAKAGVASAVYVDALREAERGLQFAWQMLSAICESDSSRDRCKARDKTMERMLAVQKVLAGIPQEKTN